MVIGIARRLKRLKEIAKQQKEVSPEEALTLWIEFMRRQFTDNEQGSPKIPDYFTPPFRDVRFEDYERARKELEAHERQAEQATRNVFDQSTPNG